MILHRLPQTIAAIVFDIDSTLYRHPVYAQIQQQLLIERLAGRMKISAADCARRVEEYRRKIADGNGGRRPSLGDSFTQFSIPIELSVEWRQDLIKPDKYLERDSKLIDALSRLSGRFPLIALTNNPGSVGRRSLECLGTEKFFKTVIGLEATMRSKPDPAPFLRAVEAAETGFEKIIFVGDRYEIDLEYPLVNGAGGILAESMEISTSFRFCCSNSRLTAQYKPGRIFTVIKRNSIWQVLMN